MTAWVIRRRRGPWVNEGAMGVLKGARGERRAARDGREGGKGPRVVCERRRAISRVVKRRRRGSDGVHRPWVDSGTEGMLREWKGQTERRWEGRAASRVVCERGRAVSGVVGR